MFRFSFKSSLIHSRSILPGINAHPFRMHYSSDAKTFDSVSIISQKTLDALEKEFKFKEMTQVQEKVLELLPTDSDLLVRAKTGTGKTLAFLIAALESALARRKGAGLDGKDIPILVISPTRELAIQIGQEACRLLYPHQYKVGVAVGGTSRNVSLQMFESHRIDLVVGTPGRIIDVLNSSQKAREKVAKLDTMILDEADRLLEMGFKEDIQEISSYLPQKKQTFMFSATISRDVRQIAQKLLLPGHKFVDTVPENDVPTHMKIKQTYLVASYSQQLILLYQIIKSHLKEKAGGKIIVFFPTAKLVCVASEIFSQFPGIDIIEMHSQLSQMKREKQASRFRRASSAIMFTTDVSARGVDYPGVTLVVQFGAPGTKDSYIHRVGRTGRAGNEGEAILILSDYDKSFLPALSGIPIKEDFRFNSEPETQVKEMFKNSLSRLDQGEAHACYFGFVNYLTSSSLNLSRDSLMGAAREFGRGLLKLESIPVGSRRNDFSRPDSSRNDFSRPDSKRSGFGTGAGWKDNRNGLYSKYKQRQSDQGDFRQPAGLGSSSRNFKF